MENAEQTPRTLLKAEIANAIERLNLAKKALADFEALAENNVYATLDEARILEDVLYGRAHDDCEGAGNCGNSEYRQEFMVDGEKHVAIFTPEYNRHDKTYYYIDGSDFRIEKCSASVAA